MIAKLYRRFRCWMGWHSYPIFVDYTCDDNDNVYLYCAWCGVKGFLYDGGFRSLGVR